jgi:acetyl-CoA carboxylase biotin carboxyl carrier protein
MNDKTILALIDKFDAASIAEMDLNDGTTRLVLRKKSAFSGPSGKARQVSGQAAPSKQGETLPAFKGANRTPAGTASLEEDEKIASPIVATFYASPSPDAPVYVSPGAKVKTGDTLCILEAMKMMNHLEAEFDCEIIRTHVSSGDLVEYGQTLFTVKRL